MIEHPNHISDFFLLRYAGKARIFFVTLANMSMKNLIVLLKAAGVEKNSLQIVILLMRVAPPVALRGQPPLALARPL